MLAALEQRNVAEILRLCMKWTGLSQAKIGALLGGKAQAEISAIINGKRHPRDLTFYESLADGLRIPGLRLGLAPRSWESDEQGSSSRQAGAGSAHERQPGFGTFDGAADWRKAPRVSGVPVTRTIEEMIMSAADESAEFGAWAEASNVGDNTLEQFDAEIRHLASLYLQTSPLPLFHRTVRLRDRAFDLLEGHQHPSQTRDLYLIAGQLCALLAWMSGDLGQPAAAETQGRTAWVCAERAGHDGLRAWVLSTRSKTAFWAGRYHEAIRFAQRGQEYAPTDTAAVMLACQEADAWAELGDAQAAKDALERVQRARDQVNSPDHIGGLFSCGPARQANYAAGVLLRMGEPDAAIREADRALAQFRSGEQRAYGTEAQTHISRAAGYLMTRQPDPEGSAEALAPLLALPAEQRLDTIVKRLQQVNRLLAHARLKGGAQQRASSKSRSRPSAPPSPRGRSRPDRPSRPRKVIS
ncbi:hypothetical protein C3Y87_14820 [Carbonactinospora thermoautotrophica]|uniref:tetratricopeptide repeat protein n=1 Tax=Carbonactinospora thermoautotrophica TaxID=1469144 RepID=UPI00226D4CCA|nr:hypothetical protein [Carbonactinospora thermoautotrophica]MCX9192663.1 hypothetical protein [Carbonactinospora thermoautotrophica]